MKDQKLTFQTDYIFTDRNSKAQYVWLKYKSILQNASILDVGADECFLKKHLPESASYWGIGLGGQPNQQVNLEKEKIPFPDNSYDCVLCLDVLEHIENIHEVFDDLCRVSRDYVIVTFPNAWAAFYGMLRFKEYAQGQALKYYGLPIEPPEDRHKWFFSVDEAKRFVEYRAKKNNMDILQMDIQTTGDEIGSGLTYLLRVLARRLLFRKDLKVNNLYEGTLWVVLKKRS